MAENNRNMSRTADLEDEEPATWEVGNREFTNNSVGSKQGLGNESGGTDALMQGLSFQSKIDQKVPRTTDEDTQRAIQVTTDVTAPGKGTFKMQH